MDRIQDPTATADNKFQEASGATPATRLRAPWLNGVQEEICRLIEAEGISLSQNNLDQLQEALRRRFPARVANSGLLKSQQGLIAGQTVTCESTNEGDGLSFGATFIPGNQAALVDSDPQERVYLPAGGDESGVSGVWKKQLQDGMILAERGKRFRLASSGVLRPDDNDDWRFLVDPNHGSVGNVSVSNPSPTVLRLTHNFTGSKNLFALVVPDETYARMGMTCGISSSPGEADISCYLPFEFTLTTDGANNPSIEVIPELQSRVSAVVRNGFNLRVVHTGGVTDAPQATPKNGSTIPVVVAHTTSSLEINQHSPSSYVYRARYSSGSGTWSLDTNDPATVTLNATNFGINGNVIFGGLTATSPPYGGAPNSPDGYARAVTWSQTSVTTRIYDDAGAVITTPTDGMEISFSRGGGLVPNGSTSLPEGSVLVRRGRIPCDFSDLKSPASIGGFPNLWVAIFMEIDDETPPSGA